MPLEVTRCVVGILLYTGFLDDLVVQDPNSQTGGEKESFNNTPKATPRVDEKKCSE